MKKTAISVSIGSLCVLLAACGGGGGSGGSSSAAPTLNLNAAYASLLQNGDTALYTLSGDCTGTSSQTSLPSYAATNYATPAVSVLAVDELQFDNLSTASKAVAGCAAIFNNNNNQVNTTFYSPSNQTIVDNGGSRYWEVYSAQAALPQSVTAGASGTLYTSKNYNGDSSTAGTPKETNTFTYSVTADSPTTLLVTFTDTGTNTASGKVAYTASRTYRLNANNTLTNLSFAINTTASSDVGALAVAGASTASATLNAQAAQVASLNAGSTTNYAVYDGDGNQCSSATITNGALASTAGTTPSPWNISYAKLGTTTFSTTGNCSNQFNLPASETAYYDANYALVQETTNNGPSNTSININAANAPLPTSATIGNTGQLYTFNRYINSNPADPTGNVIYFVGALSPTQLAVFNVTTKNYTGGYVGRQIFVNSLSSGNTVAPVYGSLKDGNTFTLIPQ